MGTECKTYGLKMIHLYETQALGMYLSKIWMKVLIARCCVIDSFLALEKLEAVKL